MNSHFKNPAINALYANLLLLRTKRDKQRLLNSFDEAVLNDLGFSRHLDFDHTQSLADLGYYTISEKKLS